MRTAIGARLRLSALGAVTLLAAATVAATAHAAATITFPADGETVTLDAHGGLTFDWTLASGDIEPSVYIGDTPTYDTEEGLEFLKPFNEYCGSTFGQVETSCTLKESASNPSPIPPGTHYAAVRTTHESTSSVSPLVRFIVPYRSGLGCGPIYPRCGYPQIQNFYYSIGDSFYGWPYTQFVVNAWANAPSVSLVFTFALGHRVVRRLRINEQTDSSSYQVQANFKMFRLPGIHPGTRLTMTMAMHGGPLTLTRKMTIRPGGGPRTGIAVNG